MRAALTTHIDAVAMKLAVKAALLLRPSTAASVFTALQVTARACGLAARKAALQGAAFVSMVEDIVTYNHSSKGR